MGAFQSAITVDDELDAFWRRRFRVPQAGTRAWDDYHARLRPTDDLNTGELRDNARAKAHPQCRKCHARGILVIANPGQPEQQRPCPCVLREQARRGAS
jgi:hypothetical protein